MLFPFAVSSADSSRCSLFVLADNVIYTAKKIISEHMDSMAHKL